MSRLPIAAGIAIALVHVASGAARVSPSSTSATAAAPRAISTAAPAAADFPNAKIAETALGYDGEWGGEACRDAKRSGLTGNTKSYPLEPKRDMSGTVTQAGDGQCRAFVNCIVKLAGGPWLGGGAGNYFKRFAEVGATEIESLDDLATGDIVQVGASDSARNLHTYVIVSRVKGSTFDIVDSNGDGKREIVAHRHRAITLDGSSSRAFRLGKVGGPDDRWTLSVNTKGDVFRAGPWESHRFGKNSSLAGLIAAFGRPTSCDPRRWMGTWESLGMRAGFDTLAAPPFKGANPCNAPDYPAIGSIDFFDRRWHTARGLSVGDSLARLRALHPESELHKDGWWLRRRVNQCCGGSVQGAFVVIVTAGRVKAFHFDVQGQGE